MQHMQQQYAIHIVLLWSAALYAFILSRRRVYELYHPDWTILTVIGGDILIGIALAVECQIGAVPWAILPLYVTLHITAGIPIGVWQLDQRRRRRREVEDIERRS